MLRPRTAFLSLLHCLNYFKEFQDRFPNLDLFFVEKLHVQGDEIVAEYVTEDESGDQSSIEEGFSTDQVNRAGAVEGENRGDTAQGEATRFVGGEEEGVDGEKTANAQRRGRIAAFFAGLCLLFNFGGAGSGSRSNVQRDVEMDKEEERLDRGVRGNRLRQGAKKTRHRRLVRIRRRRRVKVILTTVISITSFYSF